LTTLRYLLDTNICVYLRRKQPKLVARFERLDPGELAMSVVTYGELAYGCAKSAEPIRAMEGLQRLVALIPVLPLPADAGQAYGSIRSALERQGGIIGPNDLWIAAHALASDITLVTNNEREFRRVKGVKIENWAK
jgi:tRNA(fMet)-specific endonuclease VapC